MIIGVGTDMIEIERVRKACGKQAFFTRCFSVREQEMIRGQMEKAAGNFAVKEAVAKVFGTGFSGFRPGDIEVLRDERGKPYVNLLRGAKEAAVSAGIVKIHVSITNTDCYAVAFAVGEGNNMRYLPTGAQMKQETKRRSQRWGCRRWF